MNNKGETWERFGVKKNEADVRDEMKWIKDEMG